eukprot:CAMPEP_0197057684 /NCGR_PEP_ID=MMETSP1384-20130603/99572_1 /TAXON_ID=29189 /ORGANISM="Ammonia sp." /LENGTH=89 /DNA_ID=CAMNT_0042492187 /DNA_START=48 /DNA_END=317 /DNA_ORIENTATION=-
MNHHVDKLLQFAPKEDAKEYVEDDGHSLCAKEQDVNSGVHLCGTAESIATDGWIERDIDLIVSWLQKNAQNEHKCESQKYDGDEYDDAE